MAKKKVLGDFTLPPEGDIIDRIAETIEPGTNKAPASDSDHKESLLSGQATGSDPGQSLHSARGMKDAELIKENADFREVLHRFGLGTNFNGNSSAMIRCPFHADKNPSCSINFEKKLFNCFGCGKKGDIIDFVKELKGTDFKGALEILAHSSTSSAWKAEVIKSPQKVDPAASSKIEAVDKRDKTDLAAGSNPVGGFKPSLSSPAGPHHNKVDLTASQESTKKNIPRDNSNPPVGKTLQTFETADKEQVIQKVVSHYHEALLSHNKALDYLKTRGLKDFNLIKHFKIGYCDGEKLLPKCSVKQKEFLKETGLITKQDKELFTGCITFPCFTSESKIGEVYGRRISGRTPKHLYLPGPHKGVLNLSASKIYDTIILTESIIDALSLFAMGIKNVQPLFGTNGLSAEHLESLKEAPHSSLTVVLALDNDQAGKEASQKLKDRLIDEGFKVKSISPENKDWNEDLQKGIEAKSIREKIETAETMEKQKVENNSLKISKEKGKYLVTSEKIRYRLQGVKLTFVNNLKVNIKAEFNTKKFMDNVDLYSHRSRTTFSHHLASLYDLPFQKIENDLIGMVEYLEAERDRALEEKEDGPYRLTAEEISLGMELLTSPDLFKRIVDDLSLLGYVGEDLNKQLVYISATTRKMKDPISIMIVSQSASGKSLLVETVRKLMPPEDVVAVSSLSDQALNYIPEGGLLHKFLLLGEAVHSEVVEHQIREMLSNHELSRMVTTKNSKTGVMESRTVRTEVIVSAMMSSTRYDINPENASRCFVLNTDESRNQTRNIHLAQQRKYTLSRIREKQSRVPEVVRRHQAAQRLLKERLIINPLAEFLDFPDTLMRTRRDHERFIDLIAGICFLRQYQKEEKSVMDEGKEIRYLECDMTDYQLAYDIITGILPATISNFPKGAVTLYEALREAAAQKSKEMNLTLDRVTLSQREIRERTGLAQMFVKRYIRILVDYEYIRRQGSGIRGSRCAYGLISDEPLHLMDLSMIPSPEVIRQRINKSNLQNA